MTPYSAALDPWVALTIGNSHLRWAYFKGHHLTQVWTLPHLEELWDPGPQTWSDWLATSPALQHYDQHIGAPFPTLWLASVVPTQAQRWQSYPQVRSLTLEHIPLQQTYATLGLDRALALWAAGSLYGWPMLVIDAGTALTVTGADAAANLVGGAILPGLGLQLRSLSQFTAALPPINSPAHLPNRWAQSTSTAIQSGIIYALVAGLYDTVEQWRQQFPCGKLCITGGDQGAITRYLQAWCADKSIAPDWMQTWTQEPYLLLKGIQLLRAQLDMGRPHQP